jgi:hypothetical protein
MSQYYGSKAKVEIPREMEADQGIAQNNGASTDV